MRDTLPNPRNLFSVECAGENQECFKLIYEKDLISVDQLNLLVSFIASGQTPSALRCVLKLLFIAINDPSNDLSGEDKYTVESCINTLMMLWAATPASRVPVTC